MYCVRCIVINLIYFEVCKFKLLSVELKVNTTKIIIRKLNILDKRNTHPVSTNNNQRSLNEKENQSWQVTNNTQQFIPSKPIDVQQNYHIYYKLRN